MLSHAGAMGTRKKRTYPFSHFFEPSTFYKRLLNLIRLSPSFVVLNLTLKIKYIYKSISYKLLAIAEIN